MPENVGLLTVAGNTLFQTYTTTEDDGDTLEGRTVVLRTSDDWLLMLEGGALFSADHKDIHYASQSISICRPQADSEYKADFRAVIGDIPRSGLLISGETLKVPVTICNDGNAPAIGKLRIDLYASGDDQLDKAVDALMGTLTQSVRLTAGGSQTIYVSIPVPTDTAVGQMQLIADIDPQGVFSELHTDNNQSVSAPAAISWQFGTVSGRTKVTSLVLKDQDGSVATFSLKGKGTGEVTLVDGRWDQNLTGTDASSIVSVKVKGGDGRIELGNITCGSLKSFVGTSVNLAGDGYVVPLDSAGNAEIAVPLGDYFGVVHAPGHSASQMPVMVTAEGTSLDVTLDDPPTPGFAISPTSGLQTSEDGASDSFTVALTTQPSANVTIKLSSSDTSEGKISKSSLVFTPANWDVPQMVVVTGVNDSLSDGNINYSINFAPAVSTDSIYSGITPSSVDAANFDNEISPSIEITSCIPTRLSGGATSGDFSFTISGTVVGPVGTWLCVDPPSGLHTSGWQFTSGWTQGQSDNQGYLGYYAAIRNSNDPASAAFTCTFRAYVDSEDYPMGKVPDIYVLLGALPPDGHAMLEPSGWIQLWPWP